MSSSKRLKPDQVRPLLVAVVAALALVTLLLGAKPGQGRPDYEERDQVDNDASDKDEPVGASRSWGGNNKSEHVADYPWIYVLFRNPDDEYKWPLDGYQTGYAIEMQHNLFLVNSHALGRASRGEELMGFKRAKEFPSGIDPNRSEWPENGERGVGFMSLVGTISWDFGVYKLIPHDRSKKWPTWPDPNILGSMAPQSRSLGEIDPSREVRLYPIWNSRDHLDKNCYVYTFGVQDWKDMEDGAGELGLPKVPVSSIEDKFHENETRTFTRWPVKLAEPCNKSGCRFVFDIDRYWEEHRKGMYMAKRARICAGWQDVGAPIMCGIDPFPYTGYHKQGVYYERQLLRLSFVVRKTSQHTKEDWKYDPRKNWTGQCWHSLTALKLADWAEEFRPMLVSLKKQYLEDFRRHHTQDNTDDYYKKIIYPLQSLEYGPRD